MPNNYDPIDTCPYDPVHRIRRSRMQYHLTKCAKNWPSAKKKQCPYDARHVVNQMEFNNFHKINSTISVSVHKESMLQNKIIEKEETEESQILPIDSSPALPPTDDIWGEDSKAQSYDPVKYTENRLVTRILIGASKSQRKKHRMQERIRIAQLAEATNTETEEQQIKSSAPQSNNNQHISLTETTTLVEVFILSEEKDESLRPLDVLAVDTSKLSKISATNDSTVVESLEKILLDKLKLN